MSSNYLNLSTPFLAGVPNSRISPEWARFLAALSGASSSSSGTSSTDEQTLVYTTRKAPDPTQSIVDVQTSSLLNQLRGTVQQLRSRIDDLESQLARRQNASGANAVTVMDDVASNVSLYPVLSGLNNGQASLKTSSTKLSFNPSTGALTAPSFSGSTGLTQLAAITPTAAANADALNVLTSSYDEVLIIGQGIAPALSDYLLMRLANAGTADAGANYSAGITPNSSTSTLTNTSINLLNSTAWSAKTVNFKIWISNVNDGTNDKKITWESQVWNGTSWVDTTQKVLYKAAATVSGVRFYWNGGNNFAAQGKIYVYGIRNT